MYVTKNLEECHVEKLYSHFLHLDNDGKGKINKQELLKIPAIYCNPLAERILTIFDLDGDGEIDFEEFLRALSLFSCKGSREDKLKLAFSIYDLDNDGFISPGELFISIKAMCSGHLTDNQLQQVIDKTIRDNDLDKDGKIAFEEFSQLFVSRNQDFIQKWEFSDL